MFQKLLLALLVMFWHFDCKAAALTAEIDRPRAAIGENFVLTIKADENIKEMPDLSPLDTDFRVFSRSVSQQNYIINGTAKAETSWRIGLTALRAGKLEIPAIRVGNDTTKPLFIEIGQGAPAEKMPVKAASSEAYQMRAEIVGERSQYYVQQPVKYNVIITDSGSLQGGEPVFDQENGNDWIIRSLGQPDITTQTVDNKTVRTIIFKYALFPQKSGELKIPEVVFNGAALGKNAGLNASVFSQDIFSLSINLPSIFNFETPVTLHAPSQNVTVLPAPQNYPGHWWLPAENVLLQARYLENNPQFEAGQAFSREIILTAYGITENQLPQLSLTSVNGLKQYPEKSSGQTRLEDNQIVAEKKTVVVYVPENGGEIVLPEIAVDWYNINTGRFEKAILPAQTINVAGRVAAEQIPLVSESPAVSQQTAAIVPAINPMWYKNVYVLSGLAFALGMLLSYFLFRCRFTAVKPQCEMRRYPDYLIKKAYQNDFRSLRDGLISWATGFYPDKQITNLRDVAAAVNNENLSRQIDIIMAKLYNPKDDSNWNPKIFADNLQKVMKKNDKKTKNKQLLPPLYE